MPEERYLVTGALGCLGTWIVRNLTDEGVPVTVYDLGTNRSRLELVLPQEDLAQVQYAQSGDVTSLDGLKAAIETGKINRIIHLAALQIPFCRENPTLGAQVNVTGTVNVFEAARAAGIEKLVYASSIAVYGPPEAYPDAPLAHDAPFDPRTFYGVYKQANESTAKVYFRDYGISSIALRPYVIYGPARDQGMTSSPTMAMLAAVKGEAYHIPYGGLAAYQYADDVAKIFLQAARADFEGADGFNLRGQVVHMREVVEAIEAAAPAVQGKITFDDTQLPFPPNINDSTLVQAIGTVPNTPIKDGVAATVAHFEQALAQGTLR